MLTSIVSEGLTVRQFRLVSSPGAPWEILQTWRFTGAYEPTTPLRPLVLNWELIHPAKLVDYSINFTMLFHWLSRRTLTKLIRGPALRWRGRDVGARSHPFDAGHLYQRSGIIEKKYLHLIWTGLITPFKSVGTHTSHFHMYAAHFRIEGLSLKISRRTA